MVKTTNAVISNSMCHVLAQCFYMDTMLMNIPFPISLNGKHILSDFFLLAYFSKLLGSSANNTSFLFTNGQ